MTGRVSADLLRPSATESFKHELNSSKQKLVLLASARNEKEPIGNTRNQALMFKLRNRVLALNQTDCPNLRIQKMYILPRMAEYHNAS
jgi:hypothetical protein